MCHLVLYFPYNSFSLIVPNIIQPRFLIFNPPGQVYLRDRCYQESASVSSEDDYETIREASPAVGADAECSSDPPPPPPPARRRMPSRPSAIELLAAPAEGQRSLWCQLPEVIRSGVLGK